MFVHIETGWFARKPIRGVWLGIISLALWIFAYFMLYREYRGFGKAPAVVDLRTVIPPAENRGTWVRIDQSLTVRCDLSFQERNDAVESRIAGRVANTFFIAEIPGSQRRLLLEFHRGATCEDARRPNLTGVLEELNSRRRSFLSGARFQFPPRTDLQLAVGEGPESYRKMMLWGSFLPMLSIVLIVRSWSKWRRQQRKSEDLTAQLMRPYAPKVF